MDALCGAGEIGGEGQGRAPAEADDGRIDQAKREAGRAAGVLHVGLDGVHGAIAAAHDVVGVDELAALVHGPAMKPGDAGGREGEPQGFRHACGWFAEGGEAEGDGVVAVGQGELKEGGAGQATASGPGAGKISVAMRRSSVCEVLCWRTLSAGWKSRRSAPKRSMPGLPKSLGAQSAVV